MAIATHVLTFSILYHATRHFWGRFGLVYKRMNFSLSSWGFKTQFHVNAPVRDCACTVGDNRRHM